MYNTNHLDVVALYFYSYNLLYAVFYPFLIFELEGDGG